MNKKIRKVLDFIMTNIIGFPSLGLSFEINRVAFTLFGKNIYWYALIIAAGFILATIYALSVCKKHDVSSDTIYDIAIGGLICGLIGARLYYVIFDFESYKGSFLNVFKIWEGGIAIYGGIIGAAVFAYFYCRKKKLNTLNVFDVCAPGLFIGQAIGRWGNFVNAEVYGRGTDSLLRMTINGGSGVHPTFFYESMWCLIGFVVLVLLSRHKRFYGEIFFSYILWYSMGRIVFEGMRQSKYILYLIKPSESFAGVAISQVVALFLIISSAVILFILAKNDKFRVSDNGAKENTASENAE